MTGEYIAVSGCTLAYSAPVTGPAPSLTSAPSVKVKVQGNGVYHDGDTVEIPVGITNGTCTSTVVATGNIAASATKVLADGKKVLRTNDSVTVSGITGVLSGGGGCTLSATVTITNAGQTKVSGN